MTDHVTPKGSRTMMHTCPKHNRWTYIQNADGTVATRNCPECPHLKHARVFVHLPTGRYIRPPIPVCEADEHGYCPHYGCGAFTCAAEA